jgi:anti-sigma factor RsiW
MGSCLDDGLKLDYLNGTLSAGERTDVEEHVAACPWCRQDIAGLRETVAIVAGLTLPSVPVAWTDALKDRLREETAVPLAAVSSRPAPIRRRAGVIQYAAVAAGVVAGLVLLCRLVLGGWVERWLPGLSTAALGISEPGVARTVELITWIVSLHALVLVPPIIDNIYLLVRSGGRAKTP